MNEEQEKFQWFEFIAGMMAGATIVCLLRCF